MNNNNNNFIKWGILGTGKIASDFATALKFIESAKLISVGSRNINSANSFADKFQISKRYGSYKELCEDPEIEIIYISTLHHLHYPCAMLCLQNGKHVLCEKPLTINEKEIEELINLAKKKNLFLAEGLWTKYFPAMEKVRNLINEGILGEIMMVTADFGFKHSGKQRLTDPNLSGGALLDIGVYTIALSTMIYHELPSKIQALGKIGETGVDELVSIQLNYSNNKMASLICSIITPMNKEAMIYGTKGRIKIHAPFWCPTNITLFTEENKEEKKFEFSLPETNQHFNFINSIGLIYQIQYIQKKLFNKEIESDLMTVNESLINIKIMDEVRKQIGLKYPFEK